MQNHIIGRDALEELEQIALEIRAGQQTLETVRMETERDADPWNDVFFLASTALERSSKALWKWIDKEFYSGSANTTTTSTLTEENKNEIAEKYRGLLNENKVADMYAAVCHHIEAEAEKTAEGKADFDTWTEADKMFFAVREVYIMGILEGMQTVAQAIKDS